MASSARHTPDGEQWRPTPAEPDDGGQRGSLRIADKVAQRLAVHATVGTPGVARRAAGLDKLTGRALPSAQVSVASNRAAAHLKVAVTWPHPLAEVAAAVQRNVADALHVLGGLQVDRVDVTVSHLSVTDVTAPRRVQ